MDGKSPILDLKLWIEDRRNVDVAERERDVKLVLHEFYSKEVASKVVVNAIGQLYCGTAREQYSRKNFWEFFSIVADSFPGKTLLNILTT